MDACDDDYVWCDARLRLSDGPRWPALTRAGHRPRVRYFPTFASVLIAGLGVMVGLASVGLWSGARVALFATGLVGCLFVSALSLVVFLVLLAGAPRSES
jgi:hypothetical protein